MVKPLSFVLALLMLTGTLWASDIQVLVWDERQPRQKEAYPDFLGNQIAAHLGAQPGLSVTSAGLDDPEQGLSRERLDAADVLIWWGHARQDEVTVETGQDIVARAIGELAGFCHSGKAALRLCPRVAFITSRR